MLKRSRHKSFSCCFLYSSLLGPLSCTRRRLVQSSTRTLIAKGNGAKQIRSDTPWQRLLWCLWSAWRWRAVKVMLNKNLWWFVEQFFVSFSWKSINRWNYYNRFCECNINMMTWLLSVIFNFRALWEHRNQGSKQRRYGPLFQNQN